MTPRQESELKIAELTCDILRLNKWQDATRSERRIVLVELLNRDLRKTHRPKQSRGKQ